MDVAFEAMGVESVTNEQFRLYRYLGASAPRTKPGLAAVITGLKNSIRRRLWLLRLVRGDTGMAVCD